MCMSNLGGKIQGFPEFTGILPTWAGEAGKGEAMVGCLTRLRWPQDVDEPTEGALVPLQWADRTPQV